MTLTRQMDEEIVVIGAGVVGLTVALHLQELGHKVVIVAKDFPAPFETIDPVLQINYASPWAGAQNGWGRDLPARDAEEHEWRDHRFALRTFEWMEQFHDQYAEAGVNITRGFEYYEDPPAHIAELSLERAEELGIKEFELHPQSQLPRGVKLAYSFRTWTVNPMVYCCFLLRRFTIQGGRVQKRELRSPNEVFARNVKTVVNASGIGFGDDKVFVTRGQTCLVANKCEVCISHHHADGTTSFCIPRNFDGGTIVGGTHEPDNWDTAPQPGLRKKLLERIGETNPPLLEQGKLVPLGDIVGRRPTRQGGLRLEREDVGGGCVIHAYGAGGRGYELSWGVAEVVGNMLIDQGLSYSTDEMEGEYS